MTEDTPAGNPFESESPDWDALARHLAGESRADDGAVVEEWLAAHPADGEAVRKLDSALDDFAAGDTGIDVEAALASVKARFRETGPKLEVRHEKRRDRRGVRALRWRVPVPAIAAAAVLAVGALSWVSLRGDGSGGAPLLLEQPRLLATGVGVRDSLTLPDGSRVLLGPLSSVKLREGYGARDREVEITGDAWFDVAHDQARPFTVFAGSARITDLGTRFAVRSDPGGDVSVTVTEGSVSLAAINTPSAEVVTLKAGDNGTLGADGHITASRGTVTRDDTAWLEGRIVFRETPVREVLPVIHRWYGIHIRIDDPSLMSRRITATFDGESAARMIQILRLVLNADADLRGDTVSFRSAGVKTRAR